MTARAHDSVGVIGAGSSGIAALKGLRERGLSAVCFEEGTAVGGNWRYESDGAPSAAYASLKCNVSRRRMQFPSFPMPRSYGDFPHHTQMAAYLDAYVDRFDLRRHIRFSTRVERIDPTGDGWWRIALAGGRAERFRTVVVANGHHREKRYPSLPGTPTAEVSHSHDYRTPAPYAGKRVLIIGAGQSAAEIATEVSRVAARTLLSVRRGAHVVPRYLLGRPYDAFDLGSVSRLPWPVLNALLTALVRASRSADPAAYGFAPPPHRILEGIPVLSTDLGTALRDGSIAVRPEIADLRGEEVRFSDGSVDTVDAIVCATGYRIAFPFLAPSVLEPRGSALPLYRRIVPVGVPGLYFIGLVDAPTGLLPIVELQSAWLAELLAGDIRLPDAASMCAAIDAAERRTKERFPYEPPHTIRCDPHAYVRLLTRDRRRGRMRRVATFIRSLGGQAPAPLLSPAQEEAPCSAVNPSQS